MNSVRNNPTLDTPRYYRSRWRKSISFAYSGDRRTNVVLRAFLRARGRPTSTFWLADPFYSITAAAGPGISCRHSSGRPA